MTNKTVTSDELIDELKMNILIAKELLQSRIEHEYNEGFITEIQKAKLTIELIRTLSKIACPVCNYTLCKVHKEDEPWTI